MKYDHSHVEKKWQSIWEEKELFKASVDKTKPKYYVLDMFPYPSGAGLHVGHVTGYTATDIIARYKRQKGFNVLHPMGWDSFGLPAEQYAMRTGTHPRETTEKNINTYRKQLKSLGLSYDWSREFATSDPVYYKWTQWIFTKLYEKGLAYEAEVMVNFCPELGTVLSNEEVEEGKSKEGGYPIERRPLRQWVLKITQYADQLLEDLDLLNWPDHLKRLQRNWIGKSEGALVSFQEENTKESISVFTTRADTLFGVTYLVLAPEHPLVSKITTKKQKEAVAAYQKEISSRSDLERTDLSKEKTGVWTGAFAVHPLGGDPIPIWIADYVLVNYGTGAIMAVPGHDIRDKEFAEVFSLPVKLVVAAEDPFSAEEGILINSENNEVSLNGLSVEKAKEVMTEHLEKIGAGKKTTTYKLRDWLFSRQRYWGEPFPVLHYEDDTKRVLSLDELPLCPPELKEYKPMGTGESPLARVEEWVYITDPKTGKKARRETNTMPQWAGSCWYYLRFCDPMNAEAAWGAEAEKYWMPVDLYVGGVEHAVLHLLYARFWHKVLYDCGLVTTKEPFQTLRNQGLVTAKAFQKKGGGYIDPANVSFEDGKYIQKETGEELFPCLEKMSKSKLNGVTPDEIIEEYGADSLRLYEMFMGPFDKEKQWSQESVIGCRRFLTRCLEAVTSDKVTEQEDKEGLKLAYRVAYGVSQDIEALQFNTAIAKMMEFLNHFTALPAYCKKALLLFIKALYPFAPHIAEEMHLHLGGSESLTYLPYPLIDTSYLEDEETAYVVQINGKTRGSWTLPKEQTKEELLAFAQEQEVIKKHLTGDILKVIFVPNKLINIVVR